MTESRLILLTAEMQDEALKPFVCETAALLQQKARQVLALVNTAHPASAGGANIMQLHEKS